MIGLNCLCPLAANKLNAARVLFTKQIPQQEQEQQLTQQQHMAFGIDERAQCRAPHGLV